MKLPDFNLDLSYLALREGMGATEVVALVEPEWEDWTGFGIDIGDISEVEAQPDGTLTYRGRRVLVYIRDQAVRGDNDELRPFRYHVAECRTLERMRKENRFGRYVVTTRTDGQFVVNLFRAGENKPFRESFVREMGVCKNCLTALDWKSYTKLRGGSKAECWQQFDPESFLQQYGSRVNALPTQTPESAPVNQYPDEWPEIARRVKERSHWTCDGCGVSLAEPRTRKWLHVHHRDGNKANSSPSNLQALCLDCHQKEFGHERLKFTPGYRDFIRWRRTQPGFQHL